MTIKAVKYKGGQVEIDILRPEEERTSKTKSKKEPHQDFKNALKRLCRHFVIILELEKIPDLNRVSQKIQDKYPVYGFSISVLNEVERYRIKGFRKIGTGEGNAMTTPGRSMETDLYPHMDKLRADVELLQMEAEAFLNGKHAQSDQMDIEDQIAEMAAAQ